VKPEKLLAMQKESRARQMERATRKHPLEDMMIGSPKPDLVLPPLPERVVEKEPAKKIDPEKLREFSKKFVKNKKKIHFFPREIIRPYVQLSKPKEPMKRPAAIYDNTNRSLYGINYDEE
jgi:hypothetical protein